MLCPECNIEMIILELENIEIDFCCTCRGVWLDEGELELLVSTGVPGNSSLKSLVPDKKQAVGLRKCPVCAKNMTEVELSSNPPVKIDKCQYNHGLWFDNGELELVISATGGSEEKIGAFFKSVFKNN